MKLLAGERLSVQWAGSNLSIWTNGRTLEFDPEQAEQLAIGIFAVLSGEHSEAFTIDTLEPPRRTAPEFIPTPAAKKIIPTLEDI